MTTNEMWNKIVALHRQYMDCSELSIQEVWENIFVEILGYSRLEGEVERHRNIQLGSRERIIPDIIVKNRKEDLFIVELKQHNISFQKTMETQLFSYLKQLRNDVGVLICDSLYIYRYDYEKSDDEQLRLKIPFTEDNPNGIEFVEKFQKCNFNTTEVKAWIFEKDRFEINVNKIVKEVDVNLIETALQSYLSNKFSKEEIDAALNRLTISCGWGQALDNPTVANEFLQSSVALKQSAALVKSTAIQLFYQEGVVVPKPCTFASLDKTEKFYWANPNRNVLVSDWWIILNDTKRRLLSCFKVPKYTLQEKQLKWRQDKQDVIDLYILYDNHSFFIKNSDIDLKTWLVKQIFY